MQFTLKPYSYKARPTPSRQFQVFYHLNQKYHKWRAETYVKSFLLELKSAVPIALMGENNVEGAKSICIMVADRKRPADGERHYCYCGLTLKVADSKADFRLLN